MNRNDVRLSRQWVPSTCSLALLAAACAHAGETPVPDVLGIKVGVSTMAEARAALAKVSPAVVTWDTEERVRGNSVVRRAPYDIPNGKFVGVVNAMTREHRSGNQNACNFARIRATAGGYCETMHVSFTAPPNDSTVQQVRRRMHFNAGPTVENLVASLSAKYGKPSFYEDYGGRGVNHTVVWAWKSDGTQVTIPNRGHACARAPHLAQLRNSPKADAMLSNGCAVVIHATLQAQNQIVHSVDMTAGNAALASEAAAKTQQYADRIVADLEAEERKKSDTVKSPPL